MKVQWLFLPFLASLTLTAHAQNACMAKARTTVDMDACAGCELAAADRELNAVYRRVLLKHASDKIFIDKLRMAQRAWLVFRDAELAARYPERNPQMAYGSVYPMCSAGLKSQLIHARISQLRMWLVGAAEGDVCTGSLPITGDPD